MNFLDALKSGKRFRPKDMKIWCDPDTLERAIDLDGRFLFHYYHLLGEWEMEQTPCKHEPDSRTILRFTSHAGCTANCKHCNEVLEPTGWKQVEK